MINHIFTLIWNNRRQNVWLVGGLFVISLCLWFAVDYIYAIGVNQQKSLGFDWHNVYSLQVGALEQESAQYKADSMHTKYGGSDFLVFIDRLKHHPAVESVCYTNFHKHYVWINTDGRVKVDSISKSAYIRQVSPDYFRVFRVKGADGSSPEQLVEKADPNGVILNSLLAQGLFPHKEAVGEYVGIGEDSLVVTAICENQKYNEYTRYHTAVYQIISDNEMANHDIEEIPWLGLYIRVRPEADHSGFITEFRKQMRSQLMIGNLYLEDMKAMKEVRNEHLKDDRNDLYTYMAVALFFLLNVFLAVLGTFWFRTEQRKAELGLRIALGSSKVSLRGLLIGEGILILTLAFIPAMVVGYSLGHGDMVSTYPVSFTLGRFFFSAIITYLLLVLFVLIGIWFPSKQALKIQPAEALHDE